MAADRCPDCGKPLTTKPRFATKPTPRAKTWERPVLERAESLGTPLMPWQRGANRLITELRDGRPRFTTIVVSVPRQSGKTSLARPTLIVVAERADDQELYGTAQTRQYAAKHVIKLGKLLRATEGRDKEPGRPHLLTGIGAESLTWPNGTTYRPLAPNEGGGHGDSIDFMLVDEGWTVTSTVLGGVRPAMIARPMAQLLGISTMGTKDSTAWNGLVAEGRASVDDPDSDMAYIEYSAERDEDVFDESKWHEWMPALGRTIDHRSVRSAMKDLEAAEGQNEVIRAFGNRTTATKLTVFPPEWVERSWRVVDPPAQFVLALDVNDSPPGAAIASGHLVDEGGLIKSVGRVIEWADGTPHWVVDRLRQIFASRKVEAVVADFGGPAKQIEPEIRSVCEDAGVSVVSRQPREVAADTARFYSGLKDELVLLDRSKSLADAIDGAVRKAAGHSGLWYVARNRMSVDASALLAVILALGVAAELAVTPKVGPVVLVGRRAG